MPIETLWAFGLALALGLLVGLQRERVEARLAGLRTFPLITILGVLTAMLAEKFGGWVFGGAFVALAAVVVVGNLVPTDHERRHAGITTEIAILVMFAVGALLQTGPVEAAVVVGGGVAVLLYAKPILQSITAKFTDRDVRAVMQFALVTLVVLPVVPDRTFGPYDVLNPRNIWLMVVLVVAVSLGGYVARRLAGDRVGAALGGLIGGLVSSTATTVSAARGTRSAPGSDHVALLVIVLAGAVVYARVLTEIGIAGPTVFAAMAPPVAVAGMAMVVVAALTWRRLRGERVALPETENPAELKSALWFAGLYAVVLLLVEAGRRHFGASSVYVVAVLSGATDMDAITLSTTRLAVLDQLPADTAWRAILIASISNLGFKAGVVWVLGSRRLGVLVTACFAAVAVMTLLLVLAWP